MAPSTHVFQSMHFNLSLSADSAPCIYQCGVNLGKLIINLCYPIIVGGKFVVTVTNNLVQGGVALHFNPRLGSNSWSMHKTGVMVKGQAFKTGVK